jgi:ethanolamine utilization protein EutN
VKFLLIQPLDRRQEPKGDPVVAADAVHMAGPGELVYYVSAREAAVAMPNTFVPVDQAIVGIVDEVADL